ncbi:undecaprenyl-diphosphate phosphatase [Clostridium sp. AM58-1XD]|uniref:undecaprenyl-diphosphate phosphatase n=1 Tax=Clostridium sp. AM58-1XD TaxID=2292307 RepID=UPI000E5037AB|nr:undecaprenyl-diphosphate phosphatase [Clostridium sp. AM58-1XD]RGZ00346.1 undecaprenyl-diphosphate phosphatase [Clostridium sp. AM58-1XD]
MSIIEILKVLVLGIVEGFTEWLPISSTGHLIIVNQIIQFKQPDEFVNMFNVVIQLGAILAVVVMYFHKLNPFSPRKKAAQKRATVILWLKIIVACIPAMIFGLALNDWIDKVLMDNAYVIASMLILYGVFFIILEKRNETVSFEVTRVGQISYQTALYIGFLQVLAMIPGTSRSGVTILGAMLLGCSRGVAAEFSFFLGIPIMFGASFLKMVVYLKGGSGFDGAQVFYLIFGMIVAFIVSVYSIKFLMSYIKNNDFRFFGYYRIVLGIIVLAYFGINALAGMAAAA